LLELQPGGDLLYRLMDLHKIDETDLVETVQRLREVYGPLNP
jgi:hypothetical protein